MRTHLLCCKQSPIYRWDSVVGKMILFQELDSSLPIAVRHFVSQGSYYILIANTFDFNANSAESAVSVAYRLDEMTGIFVYYQVLIAF